MEYPNPNRKRPNHSGHKENKKGHMGGTFSEKCPYWPKVPGKTGPNRSNGVTKAKIYPKSEGI
jgi:hypothetical protein